jgi:hypothetical protein
MAGERERGGRGAVCVCVGGGECVFVTSEHSSLLALLVQKYKY